MLLSAGELIKKSWELYKQHWRTFILYAFLLYLVSAVIIVAGVLLGFGAGTLFSGKISVITFFLLVFLIIIAIGVVSLWISLAFVRFVVDAYRGQRLKSLGEELSATRPLLWSGILASILAALAVMGGFVLFIIPAFIFAIWFAFVAFEVAVDEKSAFDALKSSKQLVVGRWWGVLWRLVAPGLVVFVLSLILQYIVSAPFSLLANVSSSTSASLASQILETLLAQATSIVLTPFVISAQSILFVELQKTASLNKAPT